MTYAVAILGILLAISAAGNAWLFQRQDAAGKAEAKAEQLFRDTKAAAGACTASVDTLAKAGNTRQARLEAALKAVAPAVAKDQQAALKALAARPDDPRDLCASLARYWKREIEAERGPK